MIIKKTLITLLVLIMHVAAWAQSEQLTITTDSAGQLARLLPDTLRYTMAELKVVGPINGNDLRILKMIAAHLANKKSNERILTTLDL